MCVGRRYTGPGGVMTQVLTPSPDGGGGGGGGVTTATAGLRAGLKGPWGERLGAALPKLIHMLIESGPPQRLVSGLAEAAMLLGYVVASPPPTCFGASYVSGVGAQQAPNMFGSHINSFAGGAGGAGGVPALPPRPMSKQSGALSGSSLRGAPGEEASDGQLVGSMAVAARAAAVADLAGAVAAVEVWAEKGMLAHLTGRGAGRDAAEVGPARYRPPCHRPAI